MSEFSKWFQGQLSKINEGLHKFYFEIGVYTTINPRTVLGFCMTFVVITSLGWIKFEVENRPQKLYTPQNSKSLDDQAWVLDNFPSNQRSIVLFLKQSNVLDSGRDAIYDQFNVNYALYNAIGSGDATLEKTCIRNSIGSCTTQSVLAFWDYNRTIFDNDVNWIETMSNPNATDCCNVDGDISDTAVMGGIERDANGIITKVSVYRIAWTIEENEVEKGRSTSDPVAEKLEKDFMAYMEDYNPVSSVETVPSTGYGRSEAISDAFAFDGILTTTAYLIITLYATFVLSDSSNPVRSRARLAPLAVLVVAFSVSSSFGICIGVGIPFNLVINSVIFVLLGVGVDDAFVILEHMEKEHDRGTPFHLRIPRALAAAGSSITLTSVTDFAAFLAGSSTIIPALRFFCIFAAVAIFVDFALQVTLFIVFLTWDEDRIAEDRRACPCVLPCSTQNYSLIPVSPAKELEKGKDTENEGGLEMSSVVSSDLVATEEKITADVPVDTGTGVTTGVTTEEVKYKKKSFVRTAITEHLPNAILNPIGKACVLLTAAAFISAAIVGITRLELDFQYSWFVPEGTLAYEGIDIQETYFSGTFLPVFMYTKETNYYTYRADMLDLCSNFAANSNVQDSSVNCWMKRWNEDEDGAPLNGYGSEAAFYANLKTYVTVGPGQQFVDFLNWDADTDTKVVSTMTFATFNKLSNAKQEIGAMISVRDTINEAPSVLGALVFTEAFVFWEGLRVVYEETVRNVIITLVVVYMVCIIFLSDVWAATICAFNLCMIDVCLLGFIHWFGMHMNVVVAINLLLALGLTVDYSAHLAHAFMHVPGATKDDRVRGAYDKIGYSVFNGGMTTFVAALVLVFAKTYVFSVFFRCFMLIILFGLFFGGMVLPVMLSLIGPDRCFEEKEMDEPLPTGANAAKIEAVVVVEEGDLKCEEAGELDK